MRGAILYRLGLKVGEHVMRRHYGNWVARRFIEGKDPSNLRYTDHCDGQDMCNKVFMWFTRKVWDKSKIFALILMNLE